MGTSEKFHLNILKPIVRVDFALENDGATWVWTFVGRPSLWTNFQLSPPTLQFEPFGEEMYMYTYNVIIYVYTYTQNEYIYIIHYYFRNIFLSFFCLWGNKYIYIHTHSYYLPVISWVVYQLNGFTLPVCINCNGIAPQGHSIQRGNGVLFTSIGIGSASQIPAILPPHAML